MSNWHIRLYHFRIESQSVMNKLVSELKGKKNLLPGDPS